MLSGRVYGMGCSLGVSIGLLDVQQTYLFDEKWACLMDYWMYSSRIYSMISGCVFLDVTWACLFNIRWICLLDVKWSFLLNV